MNWNREMILGKSSLPGLSKKFEKNKKAKQQLYILAA